ncbi:MAG TPA: kynureninase [Candidatus Dormibacteraeota bacterium]|nr:kynureninase [Candidatus Dormibacteraeota bacterium]
MLPDATARFEPAPLDAADPLASFRDRFVPMEPDVIYLDGNSLGRPTEAAIERVKDVAATWSTRLIRGWEDGWLELPMVVGDILAKGVLGAQPGEVAVTDSTTVNLYRLAVAALDARPGRRTVVVERSEFPTDRYIVEGLARERDLEIRWLDGDPVEGLTMDDITATFGADTALLILSAVNYRSAAIVDIGAVTEAARAAGALVLWDLSHAGGSIPVELTANGVDLAVGCTYKYLNGGPGAPAFLFVRRELQDELRPPIQGWFAQARQFEMGPRFERRAGIAGWLVGTPGIIALTAAQAGIELTAEAGIEAIRAKGIALTEYAIDLVDAWLAPLGCSPGSPRDAARRGAHIAIRHPDARRLTRELIDRNVLPDFRAPDSIRIGLSPLTTSFADVHRGLSTLRELIV